MPHCVLSAMHCHRQQSQTPADTELNSCVVCLALFIASRPRKLKGCLGEGVGNTALAVPVAALLKQGHINVQETQESGCLPQCPRNTRQCVTTS